MDDIFKKILKDRKFHTPESGWDLVGIDDFEGAGDKLYTIKHFDDLDEAKKALNESLKNVDCMIIDSKGNTILK